MLFIKWGSGSPYYGYNNKYLDIARTINQKYGLTVAVSSNKLFSVIDLKAELQSVFTALNAHYQVLFAGVSSGAVAAIEQSPDIYALQKLLLINPPFTVSLPKVRNHLKQRKMLPLTLYSDQMILPTDFYLYLTTLNLNQQSTLR